MDLLLADIAYGTGPLTRLCESVVEENPTVRVVILGNVQAEIPDLIEAGAVGVVSDDLETAKLAETLQRIHCGEFQHPMELAYRIAERIRSHSVGSGAVTKAGSVGHEPLTAREREVLTMIADGSSNKQIAHKLDIRVSTVKTHVHNLLAKLRVSRRRDASREGYLRGILQAPRPA